jgi:hypothetical protein
MHRRNILIAIWVGLLAAACTAEATTLVRMELGELAGAASLIARVRCVSSASRWDGGEIWTFTTFEVVETLKGSAAGQITVRLIGGRVGHLLSKVEAVPRFQPGEETILFLEPTRAGELSVSGWAQGTFRIHRDPQSGRESVTQDTSGMGMFDPATREFRPGGVRNLPLEEFKQGVAAALAWQGQGRQK